MQTNEHPDQYLKNAYLGEIGGEEIFRVLGEALPERRTALDLLAEVERATAEFLQPHLTVEVAQADIDNAREQARARMAKFKVDSWQQLIESSLTVVEPAQARMQEAESSAPADLLSVYQTYTAHEQALVDYFRIELRGEDGEQALTDYLARL